MAFLPFPSVQTIKTIDTAETITLGTIQVTDNQELRHIRPLLYKRGAHAGLETLQMRIHSTSDVTAVYASSNVINLADIITSGNFGTSDFLSRVRFDFERPNLNKNFAYTVSLVTTNYTRNADTYYLGLSYDFPNAIYTVAGTPGVTDHPLAMQVFGFK